MIDLFRSIWSRVRKWSSTVSYFWSHNDPADCFLLMDTMLLLAGVQSGLNQKRTSTLIVRYLSNGLFAFISIILILQVWSDTQEGWSDVTLKINSLLKITTIVMSCLKVLMINHFREPAQNLKNFILSQTVTSGFKSTDDLDRRKFNSIALRMLRAMFALLIADLILLSFPNQTMDNAFRMPPLLLQHMGKFSLRILCSFFVCALPLVFVPRYFTHLSCMGILIMGMRMKLQMLAHRFRRITHLPVVNAKYNLEQINDELREILNQHMEYMGCFKMLANMVGTAFLLTHYYSLLNIGALVYMWHTMGFNGFSMVYLLTFIALLFEYYIWCRLVDSFQEVADSIGQLVYEICVYMPHNADHHSEYHQLRTSLIIIWINNAKAYTVSCYGLLKVSTLAFVDMVDITYTVLMFLINMIDH
ncbi:hypothetical protein RP20_CCG000712 [Aedes albopictus]|nr:hypothetical protein RP20_CCG000712 [Aedes albopictus]